MIALVDPPNAKSAVAALSKAPLVIIADGLMPCCASCTATVPDFSANAYLLASAPGMAAPPGSVIPNASHMTAMVLAVPITMQCPGDRYIASSMESYSCCVMFPALSSAQYLLQSVHDPNSSPRQFPLSCGPPVMINAGRSADAAPINIAGVVLSHPASNTTPSMGNPRIISSTSIAIRLRYSIDVGDRKNSPKDMVGNSNGNPPAAITPRLTCCATSLRCALQCVASLHEFAMPMTGLPANDSSLHPWLLSPDLCRNPSRSRGANHAWLRGIFPFMLLFFILVVSLSDAKLYCVFADDCLPSTHEIDSLHTFRGWFGFTDSVGYYGGDSFSAWNIVSE